MIKFKAKTTKGPIDIHAKSSWDELTLEEFIELESIGVDELTPLNTFKVITGLDIEVIGGAKGETILEKLTDICQFINKAPDFKNLDPPKKLLVGEKVVKCPLDFGETMLGQKILLNAIVVNNKDDLLSKLPRVLAIYLQPIIDKKFDNKRLPDIEKQVLQSNGVQCFALGQFFFLHSPNLSAIGLRGSRLSQKETKPTRA